MANVIRIDEDTLRSCFPMAKQQVIEAMSRTSEEAFAKYNVSLNKLAVALGQVNVESGGLTRFEENLNYSYSRLLQIFGVGVNSAAITPAEAKKLANKPKEIAMRVYGTGKKAKILGNRTPLDGWTYRGGGAIQITGLTTYTAVSKYCGIDLAKDPDKARDPEHAWDIIFGFFMWKGIWSRMDDVAYPTLKMISFRTNGGYNHLKERVDGTARMLRILKSSVSNSSRIAPVAAIKPRAKPKAKPVVQDVPEEIDVDNADVDSSTTDTVSEAAEMILARYGASNNEQVQEFQTLLAECGYHLGAADGDFGNITRDILFAFQADNGFEVEACIRMKHLIQARIAPNRQFGEARIEADAEGALADSKVMKDSSSIETLLKTGAGLIGIQGLSSNSTVAETAKELIGQRSTLVEVWEFVSPILTSPFVMVVIGGGIIYYVWQIKKDRINQHIEGRNLGR